MTGAISTPRYSAEDLETASIRSAAPSYVSEAPSYHSTAAYVEATPPYSAAVSRAGPSTTAGESSRAPNSTPRRQTIGLPPVPPAPPQAIPSIPNFRIPTWSATNAPAARLYRKVAERRVVDGRHQGVEQPLRRHGSGVQDHTIDRQNHSSTDTAALRPLEDPYLVGEQAAAEARRERLARETGDDVLQREDKQWDWLLAQMKDWEERERNWARYRRDVVHSQRKRWLGHLGGRLL